MTDRKNNDKIIQEAIILHRKEQAKGRTDKDIFELCHKLQLPTGIDQVTAIRKFKNVALTKKVAELEKTLQMSDKFRSSMVDENITLKAEKKELEKTLADEINENGKKREEMCKDIERLEKEKGKLIKAGREFLEMNEKLQRQNKKLYDRLATKERLKKVAEVENEQLTEQLRVLQERYDNHVDTLNENLALKAEKEMTEKRIEDIKAVFREEKEKLEAKINTLRGKDPEFWDRYEKLIEKAEKLAAIEGEVNKVPIPDDRDILRYMTKFTGGSIRHGGIRMVDINQALRDLHWDWECWRRKVLALLKIMDVTDSPPKEVKG